MKNVILNRRRFLRAASGAAVSGSTLGTLGLLQRAQALAQQQKGFTDYRALICVLLDGGADTYNMLLPRQPGTGNPATDYNTYTASRGNLAVGYDEQNNTFDPAGILALQGTQMGFNPAMTGLADLFNSGDLAVVANLGSLIEPATKSQILAGSVPLPPQLFSHSDQSLQWQKALADNVSNRGWFGRVADLLAPFNASQSPSMNISLVGNNLLQVGNAVVPYSIGTDGPIGIETGWVPNGDRLATVEAIMAGSQGLFGGEFVVVKQRAQDNFDLIDAALNGLGDDAALFGPAVAAQFPTDSNFFDQLRIVARMIAIRSTLGVERQTFVVNLGDWDTHDNQPTKLPRLIGELDAGLSALYAALGALGVNDQVTTFTQSEFSRTLSSNGNGTDHGWGTHQLVMGSAVQGGQIFGALPDLTIGGPDNVDRGRIIPTQSVDQYAATLSRWLGVAGSDLTTVFPNLDNFATADLGFMS